MRKSMALKEKQETSLLKFLECKLNGHDLVKQSSHLYSFSVSGCIACSDINCFALPLMGNCLLGCCCRVKCQGEDTCSARGTEEQVHTVGHQKKSQESFTWHCEARRRCHTGGSLLCGISFYQIHSPLVKSDVWQTEHCQELWGQSVWALTKSQSAAYTMKHS